MEIIEWAWEGADLSHGSISSSGSLQPWGGHPGARPKNAFEDKNDRFASKI
jgi:hypothetical protein